jgi:hypothetical protein
LREQQPNKSANFATYKGKLDRRRHKDTKIQDHGEDQCSMGETVHLSGSQRVWRFHRPAFVLVLSLSALSAACRKSDKAQEGPKPSASNSAQPHGATHPEAIPTPAPAAVPVAAPTASNVALVSATSEQKKYPWFGLEGANVPKPVDNLETRFPPPPDYKRVAVEAGSFGEWLRTLPLAAPDTPVTSYNGDVIHPAKDEYVGAVVAIDIGDQDLQQSPDVIIRLHAEWLWSKGERDGISYRSATKLPMPLSRWAKGQRLIPDGASVFWAVKNKPAEVDYPEFRKYLTAVMTWANSTALSLRASKVADPKDLKPGDFFLHSGAPGHVAVVLDVAEKSSGERVALLGQALNPTQSIHVLSLGKATAWFGMRPPRPVLTPRTEEFGWDQLRRLEPLRKQAEDDKEDKP